MDINTLPRWQCHKVVRAAKITALGLPTSGGMVLELGELGTTFVTDEWVGKHTADLSVIGSYLVVYADGYTSLSPAKAFEEGYTLLDRFDAYRTAEIKSDGG